MDRSVAGGGGGSFLDASFANSEEISGCNGTVGNVNGSGGDFSIALVPATSSLMLLATGLDGATGAVRRGGGLWGTLEAEAKQMWFDAKGAE